MILLFIAQLSNIKHISARSFCREDRFIITCNDNVLAPLVGGGNRSDIGVMKVLMIKRMKMRRQNLNTYLFNDVQNALQKKKMLEIRKDFNVRIKGEGREVNLNQSKM